MSWIRRLSTLALGLVALSGCDEELPLTVTQGDLRHPERLDFGRVPVGLGRSLEFEVSNVGSATARVLGWRAEDQERALVEVMPSTLTLTPGSVATVTVRFSPTSILAEEIRVPLLIETDIPRDVERRIELVGRGVEDGLTVEPDPVLFGRVVRGRTATRPVTLRSILPEPAELSISFETRAGTGRFFLAEGEASSLGTLEPGGERTVLLGYTPSATGEAASDRARAVVRFCGDSACEVEFGLVGEAVTDPFVCEPEPIDFGSVRPDRRRARPTVCTNASQRAIRVTDVRLEAGSDPEFQVVAPPPLVLEPGASETFEVRLDVPADATSGPRSGVIGLRSEDAEDGATLPPHPVRLVARVGGAVMRASPPALDFGLVAVGLEGRARLTLENAGDGLASVERFEVEPPFELADPTRNVQLATGESAEVELVFRPTEDGPQEGLLTVISDAVEGARLNVPLGGVALDLEPCQARWEPAALDFGDLLLYRSTTRGVQLRNVGEHTCLVREGQLLPGSQPPFQLVEGGGQDVLLEPGQAWTFVVAFRPEQLNQSSGLLQAQISNPLAPATSMPIRGAGRSFTLLLDPDEIDFGELAPGCSATQTVRVFNPGETAARLERARLVLEGGGASPFTLEGVPAELRSGGEGLELDPGQSVSFVVRYTPDGSGGRAVARIQVDVAGSGNAPRVASVYAREDLDPFVTQRWLQAGLQSVDILLVIDNSSSMSAEQTKLQAAFPRFIRYAEDRGLDYRVSVVSTDMDGGGTCTGAAATPAAGAPRGSCGFFSEGSRLERDPSWRIVSPGEMPSPEHAFARIANVGLDGGASESGLAAAAAALEPIRLSGWNSGFLSRADAFLGVVFVSDEDDQSPFDEGLYEAALAAAKGARFADRYALSGIIIDRAVCGGGDSPGATRYVGPIERSGGTLGSICQTTFDDTIDRIARAAAGVRERFVLRRPAFSPSVQVEVDGVPLPASSNGKRRWSFDRVSNAVVFQQSSVPREGARIAIRYRPICEPTGP